MRKAGSIIRPARAALKSRRLLSAEPATSTVQITTLPNKLRVATDSTPGHFSAVGLYVDGGARYETPQTSGVSHFLDRMAFKVCDILPYHYRQMILNDTEHQHTV